MNHKQYQPFSDKELESADLDCSYRLRRNINVFSDTDYMRLRSRLELADELLELAAPSPMDPEWDRKYVAYLNVKNGVVDERKD